jgi:hypothetical protein
MIIQTPNAVVFHKRILMLTGRNPFSLISENTLNPAHFREYTRTELAGYCRNSGFFIERSTFENYFDFRYADHAIGSASKRRVRGLANAMYRILPGPLKPGLCFVVRNAGADGNGRVQSTS